MIIGYMALDKKKKLNNLLMHWPIFLLAILFLTSCSETPWNSPYSNDEKISGNKELVTYSSFSERPKHLDPVRSYSSNEYAFIAQIYEPLLQYHFLKRPYELTTLSASKMPEVNYFNADNEEVSEIDEIAYSEYLITLKPNIQYQPHPAFVKFSTDVFEYHQLKADQLSNIYQLKDFKHQASRELTVADYIYQIKRLADQDLHSPIAGIMAEYIVGFSEYQKQLKETKKIDGKDFYNLHDLEMDGLKKINDYQFSIRIKGVYPQFQYWLAMPFFAPMPWEADRFYSQPLLKDKNISLNWYPVGTGAFMLDENNPNLRMVLKKNPNFHGELYPMDGETEDLDNGLLKDAGKPLPFIDKAIYSLEKETIPYWNKFLQGYYDTSGVSSDSFDQAVQFSTSGDVNLTPAMQQQGIKLQTAVTASIFYMGFNMLDDVVGGESDRARLLRQAISIAVDYEEYIAIFANGRGLSAQGPIPPGIFGHDNDNFNHYVYEKVQGKLKRKPIQAAKDLLDKAGYPEGKDLKTGKPLVLYFDVTASGPDDRARLNWVRKQFAKINIQLILRTTDYNRFQDKMLKGTGQIFWWGWNADYPDPENFLFLLYGENGKVKHGGENASNYANPVFDRLFEKMKTMQNGEQRKILINQMIEILRQDSPWLWGYHPKAFSLFHAWYSNVKPNLMANNTLKYKRVDPVLRAQQQKKWNPPIVWPIWVLLILIIISIVPAIKIYRQHEQRKMK